MTSNKAPGDQPFKEKGDLTIFPICFTSVRGKRGMLANKRLCGPGTKTILPLRDVEGLMIGYLNFFDRRVLSRVSRHYRALFRRELEVSKDHMRIMKDSTISWELQEGKRKLAYYTTIGELGGCQWLLARQPQLVNHLWLHCSIEENHFELFVWMLKLQPNPKPYGYLEAALIRKYFHFAEYIWHWMEVSQKISSSELHFLTNWIGHYSRAAVDWLNAKALTQGVTLSWHEALFKERIHLLYRKNLDLLEYAAEIGFDWGRGEFAEEIWLCEDEVLLDWAGRHLPRDSARLYHLGMQQKKLKLLTWLVRSGAPPPALPPVSSSVQTALTLLYSTHGEKLFLA